MSYSSDPNPFSAPQSSGMKSSGEAESYSEAEILQAAEIELSKTKYGLWAVASMSLAMAGFTVWQLIFVTTQLGLASQTLGNLIGIAIYAVAGVLILRITGKIKEFARNPKTYTMEEVFSAHAGYWKFVGIVAVVALAIIVPLALLSVLLIV